MKFMNEQSIRDFEFWGGAKDYAKELTDDQLDSLEEVLEDTYPDGINETELNDLMWFEPDTIAEWLGFDNWEHLEKVNSGEYEEEEEEEDEE